MTAGSLSARLMPTGGVAPPGASLAWRPLRFLNLYRVMLSGLFTALALWGVAPKPLGESDSTLFAAVAVLYFLFSLASSFTVGWRWPSFAFQVALQVCADIVAMTLMMHASGGVSSGFGMLLVVAIAGGSLLIEGRIAILFAALATLAVLGQQFYTSLHDPLPAANYTQAGMLGVAFFATAILGYVLARRVRASEALAARRSIDLANLAQLNEHIIQRMQSGILAIDPEGTVRLQNQSACVLLGMRPGNTGRRLRALAPELSELLERWRREHAPSSHIFRPARGELEVMASFASLGADRTDGTLVFLQDASGMRQRAQQLKLASLGRLTASIAHEIRNPLGAISHASQLLAESPDFTAADTRLNEIVRSNCQRVNAIVENVMQLSRRRAATPQALELVPWLTQFAEEYASGDRRSPDLIRVRPAPEGLSVRFDPEQLRQVLANLCENALRHAGGDARIELKADLDHESSRPYVDVVDNGPGIAETDMENLFEPFFTTRTDGTGLGLYIAREICEGNQAALRHVPGAEGCCFRVTFADPRREEQPAP